MASVYVPRAPTAGVLYGVVRTHLNGLLAAVDAATDGGGLPGFVINEFWKFLRCGVLSHGFARVRCWDCAFERLVPFSCEGRAICSSCCGRRMTERASRLVDYVLPAEDPVRAAGGVASGNLSDDGKFGRRGLSLRESGEAADRV